MHLQGNKKITLTRIPKCSVQLKKLEYPYFKTKERKKNGCKHTVSS